MTNHVVRLYALVVSLLVVFVAWAAIAAHPWRAAGTSADSRRAALTAYEQRLRRDTVLTRQVVAQQWADYRARLAQQRKLIAVERAAQAAPSVRIVTLPPLTTSRSS
jgi:hypothetical protein